jgi:hypothetical protein
MSLSNTTRHIRHVSVIWAACLVSSVLSGRIGGALFGTIWPFQLLTILLVLGSVLFLLFSPVTSVIRRSYAPIVAAGANLVGVVFVHLAVLCFFPSQRIANALRGEPLTWATYEGAQTGSAIALRPNDRFDLMTTSWPGISYYCQGSYTNQSGRIEFYSQGGGALRVPKSAIIKNDEMRLTMSGDGRNLSYKIRAVNRK